jgi:hypothetical protein
LLYPFFDCQHSVEEVTFKGTRERGVVKLS